MHLRNVDLNLLKAFDALMDERSVTKAAARLSLTQPAVSGTLNRLRDVVGDPLFVRTQRGVAPTARALELVAPVKRILADIESVLQPTAFDPLTARFTFTVTGTDYAFRAVVLPLIAALRTLAPGIRVAVVQTETSAVVQRMERGQLDVALLSLDDASPELHSRALFDERYVCVMREQHPAAGRRKLTLERFCELDHGIVSLQGGGFFGPTDAALAQLGLKRRVVASVPSFMLLMELVRSSDVVALMPKRLLRDAVGLRVAEPPLEVPGFTKMLLWHARTHEDPGQRWVREQLVRLCGPKR